MKDLLRAANILICLAALLYFLTTFVFGPLLNARVPLIDRAWVYVTAILIVVPQAVLLLLFLLFEIWKAGGVRRHAIVLLLIVITIGVGYVYTTGVTSPLQISPDTKRAALRPPVSAPPHPEERRRRASKDAGGPSRTSWFETHRFAMLLTMRDGKHF